MSNTQIDQEKLERLQACTSAQEAIQVLSEDGVELTDEQMEAVVGGLATSWSLEDLAKVFGDAFASLFPEGFDPATIWGNVPTAGPH